MNTDPTSNPPDFFPLPHGMKIRTPKFGAQPVSPFFPVPITEGEPSAVRPEFKICWEDQQQGLSVVVRERENGHLSAAVFCTDAGLLDKAAVSVGLMGATAEHSIHKTIPLNVRDKTGCSGSADFGPLACAVKELGPQLGVVVFLLI
jgi:hypothetical protein